MKKQKTKTKTIMLRVSARLYGELYKKAVMEEKSVPEVIREMSELFLFSNVNQKSTINGDEK